MSSPRSAGRVEVHIRELAFRESDGIAVTLLWDQSEDRVLLDVYDTRTDASVVCGVASADALDAFHHPFVYSDCPSLEEGS
jgi:carotenoid cleavage dioxygenase-like enzyme